MMRAAISVNVRPFPSIAEVDIGEGDAKVMVPLSTLNAETLDALCREFRAGVFKCAGKVDSRAEPRSVDRLTHSTNEQAMNHAYTRGRE
jgi:hypothetical protein